MQALYWLARGESSAGETRAAREALAEALRLYEASPVPLLGFRLQRLALDVAVRSGDHAAAQRARSAGDALVSRIAAAIDDPTLQRCFLREAGANAPRARLAPVRHTEHT